MITDQTIWEIICEGYDYRFFSGLPFDQAQDLYGSMAVDIMHYVPAVEENVALMLASGAWTSGIKSGVLMSPEGIGKLDVSFNIEFKVPVLIVTKGEVSTKGLYVSSDLKKVISYIEKNRRPGVLVLP